MALVTGAFELKWGDTTLTDISEIDVEYEQDSETYTTVQHTTREVDGSQSASVTLTLLASDTAALRNVLPQNFVANGGVLSTGETVSNANGAIDVTPSNCTTSVVHKNLDIIGCGNPGQVFRLVNARTRVDSVDFDDKIRTIMVKFIGVPDSSEASIQFFTEGTINVVS